MEGLGMARPGVAGQGRVTLESNMETGIMDINVSSEAMAKIAAFRGVYVLCRVNIKEKKLTAQYLASCLTSGRTPMWGVFDLNGIARRFFSSRAEVEAAHPALVWRRYLGHWQMQEIAQVKEKASSDKWARNFYLGE